MSKAADTPGVIAPPPIIFFGIELVGLLLHWLVPVHFLPDGLTPWVGWPLIVIGGVLGFSALAAFRRAGTSVDPYEPSSAIATDGPYRFTRNPIYVSFVLICLGITSLFNALWALVLLPVAIVIVDRFVIAREERYLEAKFGETYKRYKAVVRRWL